MNRTPPHAPGDGTVTLDISVTPFQPGERRGTILRLGADSFKLSQEQGKRLAGDLLEALRPDFPSRTARPGPFRPLRAGRVGRNRTLRRRRLHARPRRCPHTGRRPDRHDPDRRAYRYRYGQADRTRAVRRAGLYRRRSGMSREETATRPGSLAIRGDIPGGCVPRDLAEYTKRDPA